MNFGNFLVFGKHIDPVVDLNVVAVGVRCGVVEVLGRHDLAECCVVGVVYVVDGGGVVQSHIAALAKMARRRSWGPAVDAR